MPLGTGVQLLPRLIAAHGAAAGWENDVELAKMVATALGESQGYLSAWHPNLGTDGVTVLSQDDGIMQINIPATEVGGAVDDGLRTSSHDPAVWEPIATRNIAAAFGLYSQPGPNRGHRRWGPWVSYIDGWSTFPAWWVWAENAQGKSIGPWNKTGRYIHRAIVGVANYHLIVKKNVTETSGVKLANTLAAKFGIEGSCGIRGGLVEWTLIPPEPTEPPENGIGPRPVVNRGL